jgi:hypothetical protein
MAVTSGETTSRPLPDKASADSRRILVARGLRAFGDGFVALLVPIYLLQLGFSALEIGAIVTATLVGTALVTLWAGMVANRYSVRRLLLAARPRAMPASSCRSSRRHWPRPPIREGAPRSSPATA